MRFLYAFLISAFIISCSKDPSPTIASIEDLTADYAQELQYRTQLRMAFGKTVANAFGDVPFSKYVQKMSKRTNSKFFDEIVFAMHKEDIVYGDRTLQDVLTIAIDKEVKDLFGDDFIDKVLSDDPLVSIKIPDVFFNFNWEAGKYSPLVYVKTPERMIIKEINKFYRYPIYHYTGFHDMVYSFKPPEYFCVLVKYSEDHLLVNLEDKISEKGIPFLSIVPQANSYWDDTEEFINQNGLVVPEVSYDLTYINKRALNRKFLSLFDQENYYLQVDNPDCYAGCVIDCAQDIDELNNVLSHINFRTSIPLT